MKNLLTIIALLCLISVSATVTAATPPEKGREVIDLKMGSMVLPFKHREHQKRLNDECFHCHTAKIGQIEGWSKDTAHKICIACHELEDKGPTECGECHKK